VLLIIDPSAPAALRAAAAITQELRRAEGSWLITRRIVTPPTGQRRPNRAAVRRPEVRNQRHRSQSGRYE
jgi:hypothetical protein